MTGSRWLTRLVNTCRKVRRWFLQSLFRRDVVCRRLVTPARPQETNAGIPGTEHSVLRDDTRLTFISTEPTILKPQYQEIVAPLLALPDTISPDALKQAIENLNWVQRGSPPAFPLAVYSRQGRLLPASNEWLHFGKASRRLALELTGNTGADEDTTSHFILHVARTELST